MVNWGGEEEEGGGRHVFRGREGRAQQADGVKSLVALHLMHLFMLYSISAKGRNHAFRTH